MVDWKEIQQLGNCFPGWYINSQGEFIAHAAANEYFKISTCESALDIQCKVLEWLSRAAYKTAPFSKRAKNEALHRFMRDGINRYFGTEFGEDEFTEIYARLGNCVNHALTVEFVKSGCNMDVLLQATPAGRTRPGVTLEHAEV